MKKESVLYGKFENSEWKQVNGLESVAHVLERIKNEVNFEEYQLWVHGSILSDVDTYDIDLSIIGPLYPQIINQMLETIVKIGFEEQIFCDVKYSVDNHIYDPVNDAPKNILWACYQSKIQINGQTYHYGQLVKDLHLNVTKYPMNKTLRSGIVYKSPIKIA
jgi:hypothetical protein